MNNNMNAHRKAEQTKNIQAIVTGAAGIILTTVSVMGTLAALAYCEGAAILFAADKFHNVVHMITGIIGITIGIFGGRYSAAYNKMIGITYLALFFITIINPNVVDTFIHSEPFDATLHLLVGLVLTYFGFRQH